MPTMAEKESLSFGILLVTRLYKIMFWGVLVLLPPIMRAANNNNTGNLQHDGMYNLGGWEKGAIMATTSGAITATTGGMKNTYNPQRFTGTATSNAMDNTTYIQQGWEDAVNNYNILLLPKPKMHL